MIKNFIENFITALLMSLLFTGVLFLAFAFAVNDLNPQNWVLSLRVFMTVIAVVSFGVCFFMVTDQD